MQRVLRKSTHKNIELTVILREWNYATIPARHHPSFVSNKLHPHQPTYEFVKYLLVLSNCIRHITRHNLTNHKNHKNNSFFPIFNKITGLKMKLFKVMLKIRCQFNTPLPQKSKNSNQLYQLPKRENDESMW